MARTPEQIAFAYQIARDVFEQRRTKEEGIKELSRLSGLKRGSAKIIIGQVFPNLMSGQLFKRTLSAPLFEYFLERIYQDDDTEVLITVLTGLEKHINYTKQKGDAKIRLREIYFRYKTLVLTPTIERESDDQEQEEIVDYYQNITREKVLDELRRMSANEPSQITINRKVYKRNNRNIALIKLARHFQCQICNTTILQRNGKRYVEAAHIDSKNLGGPETPQNIILLCPNHHKEFDLGHRVTINRTNSSFEFLMNGNRYVIDLSIT